MKAMKSYWLTIAIVLLAASPSLAQRARSEILVLRGTVRDIKYASRDPNYVDLVVAVDIEFANMGGRPVIFLRPQEEREAEIFWPGVVSLSLAKFLAERGGCNSTIWVQSRLPSVDTSPEFREVAKRLDQPSPPPGLTKVLRPKETWVWQTTVFMRFSAKTKSSGYSEDDLGWDVIGKLTTPLWMRLDYEVWSPNLQRANKGLRERLQKRWRGVGWLDIQPALTTEPIELRLNSPSSVAPNNGMQRSADTNLVNKNQWGRAPADAGRYIASSKEN